MKYNIKSENVEVNDFRNIAVKNLFNEKTFEKLSIAKVQIKGNQDFGLDKKSDIFYYVLNGQGRFFIEDQIIEVKEGDLVYIPKNTRYKDEGNLKLLAISSPRFDSDNYVKQS